MSSLFRQAGIPAIYRTFSGFTRQNSVFRFAVSILFFLLLGGLSTPRSRAAETPQSELTAVRGYYLTVSVDGVRNNVGTIGMLLFNSPDGWPDTLSKALRGQKVQAVQGSTVLRLNNLPEGDYGVLVIHDENGNDKLDRDWKGIPKEQWGMSNNPRVLLSAPTFQQAKFHLSSDREIHIILK
ncbi:MAG TPA: DUF2141 domain-containing protein [Candidatus Acidoferrales bacterium]|nr:DUF2141 domain-containing protein [Candidatus Acidoferrales bacterium]